MCGIFGVIRKPGATPVPGRVPADAMAAVRHRGSGLGAGFGRVTARGQDAPFMVRAFVDSAARAPELAAALKDEGFILREPALTEPRIRSLPVWTAAVTPPDDAARAVDRVNARFLDAEGLRARIIAAGRYVGVWKAVAHCEDVANAFDLAAMDGDAWVGHTREPTNSPGRYPIWSHPFSAGETALVHNGDLASFGANQRFLRRAGYSSFSGTDSEVAALLLHHLTAERGLDVPEAAAALVDATRGDVGADLAGAALDGPFSIAAALSDGNEAFLLVMVDRSKLRPLVLGEDEHAFYAASEEQQIRAVSKDARIWTPAPGGVFLATSKRGLVSAGRVARRPATRGATGAAPAARGARFLAAGLAEGRRVHVTGPTGNCLANALDGGDVEVFGNIADDAADAMLRGRVVVHGDARDVLGQALQGGHVLVRGDAGNRVGLQMREYEDVVPTLVVGGGVDDYFGEYMAGGVAAVLNLVEGPDGLTTTGAPDVPVGRYLGTGMVGGTILVRGHVPDDAIGLVAASDDVTSFLDTLVLDGALAPEQAEAARAEPDPSRLREWLPDDALGYLHLLESKYAKRPTVTRGALADEDRARLLPVLDAYAATFGLSDDERAQVLASDWTVVQGVGARAAKAEEG